MHKNTFKKLLDFMMDIMSMIVMMAMAMAVQMQEASKYYKWTERMTMKKTEL